MFERKYLKQSMSIYIIKWCDWQRKYDLKILGSAALCLRNASIMTL